MMFVQLFFLTLYASIDSVYRTYYLTYLGMWIAHMGIVTHWWCNANFNFAIEGYSVNIVVDELLVHRRKQNTTSA